MPVPARPRPGLVGIKAQFRLGRLEAVLDRPAPAFHAHQQLQRGPLGAPSGEEGQALIGQTAPDQQAARPQALAAGIALLGGLEIGQLPIGPVIRPWPFAPLAGR